MNRPGAWWGISVGAVIGYTVAVLLPLAPLEFYPRLGTWSFGHLEGEIPIRWYGFLAYAVAGGALGMVLGRLAVRRPPWSLVWPIATVALALLVWHERRWWAP